MAKYTFLENQTGNCWNIKFILGFPWKGRATLRFSLLFAGKWGMCPKTISGSLANSPVNSGRKPEKAGLAKTNDFGFQRTLLKLNIPLYISLLKGNWRVRSSGWIRNLSWQCLLARKGTRMFRRFLACVFFWAFLHARARETTLRSHEPECRILAKNCRRIFFRDSWANISAYACKPKTWCTYYARSPSAESWKDRSNTCGGKFLLCVSGARSLGFSWQLLLRDRLCKLLCVLSLRACRACSLHSCSVRNF